MKARAALPHAGVAAMACSVVLFDLCWPRLLLVWGGSLSRSPITSLEGRHAGGAPSLTETGKFDGLLRGAGGGEHDLYVAGLAAAEAPGGTDSVMP